ncbi:glycosyltransferase family 2 protein [Myroides odoratimimus]|uniref:glycosyltransferase family 2 protein n=1 Tax=Myroides odoratimimus TaxID=76832 RepID=UPI0025767E1B|nr:glycosyltransferase family A protein [Myroides odoratimimus]MDM1447997.1 glycosyltransferase family 2 protein [Myroides odoratimimus]
MLLSIVTPTYNRAYCLPRIYNLLCEYKDYFDFEWIIINDGSSDDTELIVNQWLTDKVIALKYVKQSNKGKTNALVNGFSFISDSQYSVVLDSDDILTENFFKLCLSLLDSETSEYIGFVGLKSDFKEKIIGTSFVKKEGTYLDIYFGKEKTKGDKLFVVRSDIYRKSLVQSFLNEKLIPESVFYLNMKLYGVFLFKNVVIYKGDYLEDGLSFDSNSLAAKNIKGFIYEKKLLQEHLVSFVDLIVNDVKFIVFSVSGGENFFRIVQNSKRKLSVIFLYLPSIIVKYKMIRNIKKMRLKFRL